METTKTVKIDKRWRHLASQLQQKIGYENTTDVLVNVTKGKSSTQENLDKLISFCELLNIK